MLTLNTFSPDGNAVNPISVAHKMVTNVFNIVFNVGPFRGH